MVFCYSYSVLVLLTIADFAIPRDEWFRNEKTRLEDVLKTLPTAVAKAKNVILFVGDGMSLSTITAARIFDGQSKGRPGEENYLVFEKFPHLSLLKTYSADKQVSDSSATATAMLTGVKVNSATVGVTDEVIHKDCSSYNSSRHDLRNIFAYAHSSGKSTGLVTTVGVTDATPASAYAHSPNRHWVDDTERNKLVPTGSLRKRCLDNAAQLVRNPANINVIFGGGRKHFLPQPQGTRTEKVNLIDKWQQHRKDAKHSSAYLDSYKDLTQLRGSQYDWLLGLFAKHHFDYHSIKNRTQPTLANMTTAAVKLLRNNSNGFFLFVESGLIDKYHHANKAGFALDQTVALNEAIAETLKLVDLRDTLILVTADHSQTMVMHGIPRRGNNILGVAKSWFGKDLADDGLPLTTLVYSSGPAGLGKSETRGNLSSVNVTKVANVKQAFIKNAYSYHSGEDVPLYTIGPGSELLNGVYEQHYIGHVMMYAACLGPYSLNRKECEANSMVMDLLIIFICIGVALVNNRAPL